MEVQTSSDVASPNPKYEPDLRIGIHCRNGRLCRGTQTPTSSTRRRAANGRESETTRLLNNPKCLPGQIRTQRASGRSEHHAPDRSKTLRLLLQEFARDFAFRPRSEPPFLRDSDLNLSLIPHHSGPCAAIQDCRGNNSSAYVASARQR